jgi:hypothetical protein
VRSRLEHASFGFQAVTDTAFELKNTVWKLLMESNSVISKLMTFVENAETGSIFISHNVYFKLLHL